MQVIIQHPISGFFSLQSLRIPEKVYRYSRSDQLPDRSHMSDIQDLTYSITTHNRAQSEGSSTSRQEIINQAELEIQTITRNYEASFSYTDEDSNSSKN